MGDFKKRTSSGVLWTFGVLWLMTVSVGFRTLLTYSGEAGPAGIALNSWPGSHLVAKNSTGPTLLVFAHPQCPCTRATALELEQLVARTQYANLEVYVLIYTPAEVPAHWVQTDLPSRFANIPRVKVVLDKDGLEAQRFGALTSGQTFLYGKDGKLLFKGGITAARGHQGDNRGLDSLTAIIGNKSDQQKETKVFGCSLGKVAEVSLKKGNSDE